MLARHVLIVRRHGKRDRRRHGLAAAHSPEGASAGKSLLCMTVAVIVLLGTLALAATASAEPAPEASPPAEPAPEAGAPVGEPPPEGSAPPEPTPEGGTPVTESRPEAGPRAEPPAETGAPITEPAPEEAEAPIAETVSEAAAPIVEPVPETPAPIVEAVPEVPAPILESGSEETLPAAPIAELVKEVAAAGGQGSEASAVSPQGGEPAAGTPAAATTETSSALIAPPIASDGEPTEATTGLSAAASIIVRTPLTAAQRAAELSCQLSGLSGPATDNCAVAWPGAQSFATGSGTLAAAAGASTGTGAPPGGGYGSSGGGRTVIPPPGPTPGGAIGGSGIALSGFFTLAGLLLLAAPLAMRRLRLSCQPWLTAFFVLIPERPG
jgi:hypothetical protein